MKFKEHLNNYVFTTRFVLEKTSPIVFVSHDEEGDWQFLSKEGAVEAEAKIMLLREIIQLDPSVMDVTDMPVGSKAYRNDQNSTWRIESKLNL